MPTKHARNVDVGLLILRLGIGALFIRHGWMKLTGGPEAWEELGKMFQGLVSMPLPAVFWGFMAMFAEFGGGIALVLGVLVHPFLVLLFITMVVASALTWPTWPSVGYPLSMAVVVLSLFLIGPGRYSIYARVSPWIKKRRAKLREARKAKKQARKNAPSSSNTS